MSYVIRCYEGQDDWGNKKWLAHLNLGNDIYMSFLRATKKDAEAAAREWYEVESKRFKHLDSSSMDDKPAPVKVMNDSGWGVDIAKDGSETTVQWHTDNNKVVIDNISVNSRVHHFVGKVWMVKGEGWDKQKKRVDKSEVEALEADGWRRGGPRS